MGVWYWPPLSHLPPCCRCTWCSTWESGTGHHSVIYLLAAGVPGVQHGRLVLATTQSSTSLLQVYLVFNMVKELITIEMERDSLQQKWGFTVQGGKDVSLTAKIASVKRFSPADRAGLEKMDYVWTVNGKEVFNMTQPQ